MDCSPPDSPVRGIFRARIVEFIAVSYFRGSFLPRDWTPESYASCIGRRILYHCATWEASSSYSCWCSVVPFGQLGNLFGNLLITYHFCRSCFYLEGLCLNIPFPLFILTCEPSICKYSKKTKYIFFSWLIYVEYGTDQAYFRDLFCIWASTSLCSFANSYIPNHSQLPGKCKPSVTRTTRQ